MSSDYTVFMSWYTSKKDAYINEESGRLNQKKALEFANAGKNYQEILDYFYSGSDASSGSIIFLNIGKHFMYSIRSVGGKTYSVCRCGNMTEIMLAK